MFSPQNRYSNPYQQWARPPAPAPSKVGYSGPLENINMKADPENRSEDLLLELTYYTPYLTLRRQQLLKDGSDRLTEDLETIDDFLTFIRDPELLDLSTLKSCVTSCQDMARRYPIPEAFTKSATQQNENNLNKRPGEVDFNYVPEYLTTENQIVSSSYTLCPAPRPNVQGNHSNNQRESFQQSSPYQRPTHPLEFASEQRHRSQIGGTTPTPFSKGSDYHHHQSQMKSHPTSNLTSTRYMKSFDIDSNGIPHPGPSLYTDFQDSEFETQFGVQEPSDICDESLNHSESTASVLPSTDLSFTDFQNGPPSDHSSRCSNASFRIPYLPSNDLNVTDFQNGPPSNHSSRSSNASFRIPYRTDSYLGRDNSAISPPKHFQSPPKSSVIIPCQTHSHMGRGNLKNLPPKYYRRPAKSSVIIPAHRFNNSNVRQKGQVKLSKPKQSLVSDEGSSDEEPSKVKRMTKSNRGSQKGTEFYRLPDSVIFKPTQVTNVKKIAVSANPLCTRWKLNQPKASGCKKEEEKQEETVTGDLPSSDEEEQFQTIQISELNSLYNKTDTKHKNKAETIVNSAGRPKNKYNANSNGRRTEEPKLDPRSSKKPVKRVATKSSRSKACPQHRFSNYGLISSWSTHDSQDSVPVKQKQQKSVKSTSGKPSKPVDKISSNRTSRGHKKKRNIIYSDTETEEEDEVSEDEFIPPPKRAKRAQTRETKISKNVATKKGRARSTAVGRAEVQDPLAETEINTNQGNMIIPPQEPCFPIRNIVGPLDIVSNLGLGKIKIESDYIPPPQIKVEPVNNDNDFEGGFQQYCIAELGDELDTNQNTSAIPSTMEFDNPGFIPSTQIKDEPIDNDIDDGFQQNSLAELELEEESATNTNRNTTVTPNTMEFDNPGFIPSIQIKDEPVDNNNDFEDEDAFQPYSEAELGADAESAATSQNTTCIPNSIEVDNPEMCFGFVGISNGINFGELIVKEEPVDIVDVAEQH